LIAVGVLIVMGLICFWNFHRRFKAAASASAHHWKEPKAERRRPVGASSSRISTILKAPYRTIFIVTYKFALLWRVYSNFCIMYVSIREHMFGY
jgi:hypothetical protein